MPLTQFSVHVAPGEAGVALDGKRLDVPYHRVTVDAVPNDVPKIYIEVTGEGQIEGVGLVHIVKPGSLDHREVVLEWLGALDPDHIEEMVLADLDGTKSTGQAFIDALRKEAGGDH